MESLKKETLAYMSQERRQTAPDSDRQAAQRRYLAARRRRRRVDSGVAQAAAVGEEVELHA